MAARANNSQKRLQISKEDWEQRLTDVHVSKEDLNRLVMDYLVIEGYREAAENFARESGQQPSVDLDSIEYRTNIAQAIRRGDVEEAISKVNDMNPEILDSNPSLFFSLQQQRMIEYIRNGQIAEALNFAQQELAPRGEENPGFLAELERTMALLAFDTSLTSGTSDLSGATSVPSEVHELLHPAQRVRTARQLNAAILTSQSHGKDAKLPQLLRMMSWGERMLGERADFESLNLAEHLMRDRSAIGPTAGGSGGFAGRAKGVEDTMMAL